MCFLPETYLCRYRGCTPPPPSGSGTECRRYCVDLYSWQAERRRQEED